MVQLGHCAAADHAWWLWALLQVVLAAIFDLLFSQCDRHGSNLYLQPDGSLVLIDNDQVRRVG